MGVLGGTVRFFQEGGAFMYPILFVFALGAAIAVERWMYLTVSGASNRALWKKIVPFLKAGNFQEAAAVTNKSKAAIASILTYGLYRVKSARRRDDIEKAMEESLMEVLPRLEKRTHYLATLANIATLLGLLGTIIGLISAFTAVSNANPADKYLGGDEHDGVRPDVRHSAAPDARSAAVQDRADRRQPGDGQRQVSERGDRAPAEAGRSINHDS